MNVTNLDEKAIRHLIDMHEDAIAQLKAQIATRPVEPAWRGEFPPAVGFFRCCRDYPGDNAVDRPFVAIRYATGTWFINRGGGAPSGPLTWDQLLDWIEPSHWDTICHLARAEKPRVGGDSERVITNPDKRALD
ncbi:hypothetical protein SEA_THUMB_77 [Mycobacterium phage Thumb]|nr:hypothetical protein SEA_THUMB_77 [Mycobacterium phage Thumb]